MSIKKPEIIVFAGPNGSGKSTVTEEARTVGVYINADEIKKAEGCSDLEAAQKAEELRMKAMEKGEDFTFETVLSTWHKLEFLKKAKAEGYFIRCVYVLTTDPNINVLRTIARVKNGGHGVPPEKVIERYHKCMKLIKNVFDVSDVFYLYDNTTLPRRILVKKKNRIIAYTDEFWTEEKIAELFGLNF